MNERWLRGKWEPPGERDCREKPPGKWSIFCQFIAAHLKWMMGGSQSGALGWWLAPLPFTPESGIRFPVSAVWKKQKMFLPHPRVNWISIVGSLRDREVACSASDRQGPNFESCVWRTVSSQSSHHPQEVLLAQFSLYVHKGGLKPDSFHYLKWPVPLGVESGHC